MKIKQNRLSLWLIAFAVFLFLSSTSFAQRGFFTKHDTDFGVSIYGQFSKSTDGSNRQYTTYSPGFLGSFRQSYKPWLGYEVNYSYQLNSEVYSRQHLQHDVHEATAAYLFETPKFHGLQPFLLAGGGALVFSPLNSPYSEQARATGLYGAGVNYMVPGYKHAGLRFQYRGLVYHAPNFNQPTLANNFRHNAEPTAGFFFRF
jgi:hypothetical protein